MSGHAPANLPGTDGHHSHQISHAAHGHAHQSHGHDAHGHADHHGHDDHHGSHAVAAQRPYMERLFEILAEPIWKFSGDFERRNAQKDHAHH